MTERCILHLTPFALFDELPKSARFVDCGKTQVERRLVTRSEIRAQIDLNYGRIKHFKQKLGIVPYRFPDCISSMYVSAHI